MGSLTIIGIAALIFAAAVLYSSVGHAGASGYLAAMALFGVAPAVMKPAALSLNILVAAITSWKFYRAGCFSWRIFWPFALASVPCAFIGGALSLPTTVYKPIVGVVLLYAAVWLFRNARSTTLALTKPLPVVPALALGVGIGLLSGLTGVGGGIFLSPLLLFMEWADTRQASGVSAVFILVNSIAGLGGHLSSLSSLPRSIAVWAAAAIVGGWIGAEWGSRRLAGTSLRRLLAVVLVVAGLKLMFV